MKHSTMTQSLVLPLAAAFVSAVALAGCQSNDTENTGEPPATEEHPTKGGEHPTGDKDAGKEGEHPNKKENPDKKEHPSN